MKKRVLNSMTLKNKHLIEEATERERLEREKIMSEYRQKMDEIQRKAIEKMKNGRNA